MDREYKLYELRSKIDREKKIIELIKKAETDAFLTGFDFSILMQKLLISPTGYVIDTGNYENVNSEVALRLHERIKKHPLLWKLFMVA